MFARKLVTAIVPLVLLVCLPAVSHSKRPAEKDNLFYLLEMYEEAEFLIKNNLLDEAEDTYLRMHLLTSRERGISESHWLTYMQTIRKLISFYYSRCMYLEAGWYYDKYSIELIKDNDEEAFQLMLEQDLLDVIADKIERGLYNDAECAFIFLTGELEKRFDQNCYLLEVLYLNRAMFYRKTGDDKRASECTDRVMSIRRSK